VPRRLRAPLEDVPEDEGPDDGLDTDEAAKLEQAALVFEEKADIQNLLRRILQLPPDTKLGKLKEVIASLRKDGYQQVMVFTQYTDTMDFLRNELRKVPGLSLMCFSGRGGEVAMQDGGWRLISRDDAKRRFREKQADVLLCTDAAAEGLNFQFCGALVNYDMPWSPMRVEQRIGNPCDHRPVNSRIAEGRPRMRVGDVGSGNACIATGRAGHAKFCVLISDWSLLRQRYSR
jgi:superfamily II DNA/RNA helicase